MDTPLTLKSFIITLLVFVVVAAVPVGYMWTIVTAGLDNTSVKLKAMGSRLDQIEVCQRVRGHALANKDRIESADERVVEMDDLLLKCAAKLRKAQSVEAGK